MNCAAIKNIREFRLSCKALVEGWLVEKPEQEMATAVSVLAFVRQTKNRTVYRAFLRLHGASVLDGRLGSLLNRANESSNSNENLAELTWGLVSGSLKDYHGRTTRTILREVGTKPIIAYERQIKCLATLLDAFASMDSGERAE